MFPYRNPPMPGSGWRKSSYSSADGDCVEAGNGPGIVLVRDTKDPQGPVLRFSGGAWRVFAGRVKSGT